jgi:DNA-binding SARP family transcriptional activator/pimeloyl-ACP methyl ester carboxylesterase
VAEEILDIQLLGQFAVARDGKPVPLPPSKKTRALLAYLAMSGRAQRREQLCSMFWDLPDDPRGALRWSLTKIRSLVDGEEAQRLHADRELVRFEPRGARIDALALKAGAEKAAALPLDALLRLAPAADGEFLAGLELPDCDGYQAWCMAQREDIRGAACRVLRALAERLRDRPAEALPHARRLVELEPFDGAARVTLVKLLAAAGRRQEAEQQRALGIEQMQQAGVPVHALIGARREIDAAAPASGVAPPLQHPAEQQVHFCTTRDGVRLAYATAGAGPPLVKAWHWPTHTEFDWRSPVWGPIWDFLTAQHTLVRYDGRASGLSDSDVGDIAFESMVEDLATVVEASGLKRFPLLGMSTGAAISIAYAARHPERVERLILCGGYARGWNRRSDRVDIEKRKALVTLVQLGWGEKNPAVRQIFTTEYIPKATPEQMQWFSDLQRVSTSPEGTIRLSEVISNIDVSAELARVRAPTLVIHCRGDVVVPFTQGRELATGIPGARFLSLDSANHFMLEQDPAWPVMAAHIREFLAMSP